MIMSCDEYFESSELNSEALFQETSSEDDSMWEDVPLEVSPVTHAESSDTLSLTIGRYRSNKHDKWVQKQRYRRTIHHLGMICYLLTARRRNKWISNPRILKQLKKLLPDSFIQGRHKSFKKAYKKFLRHNDVASKESAQLQFKNILKYLIKWFRLNYKLNLHGIRVSGYVNDVQKARKTPFRYFPCTAPPIKNVEDFRAVIKAFKHNRDTGAQLLTGLIRSLGFEARLVFSLPLLPTKELGLVQPVNDKPRMQHTKDIDLLYPYFWTEVIDPCDESCIHLVEAISFENDSDRLVTLKSYDLNEEVHPKNLHNFYTSRYCPTLSKDVRMTMQYVVALEKCNNVIDVSPRYMKNIAYRYYKHSRISRESLRSLVLFRSLIYLCNGKRLLLANKSKEQDILRKVALINNDLPKSYSDAQKNLNFCVPSLLKYNETIAPGAKVFGKLYLPKFNRKEPIYLRRDVTIGRSEEQWRLLGRCIKEDQFPFPVKKIENILPRTLKRRRIHNSNKLNGDDHLNFTHIYLFDQTQYIKRPSLTVLESGKVSLPRNEWGNIEIFSRNMVPRECVWVTLSNIEDALSDYVQKKFTCPINTPIEYVPVVTGFNFKSKPGYAIPIRDGVIVLERDEVIIKRIWLHYKTEMFQNSKRKLKLECLRSWNTLVRTLRIKARLDDTYGENHL